MDMGKRAEEHLRTKILPFWKGLKDEEFGGFYGYVDFDRKIDRQAVKGCILNSRILWFFSNAAAALHQTEQPVCLLKRLRPSGSCIVRSQRINGKRLVVGMFCCICRRAVIIKRPVVSDCPRAAKRLEFMMNTIAEKIYNPQLRRQEVFFDRELNSILDLHSYGHDIETAWLVDRGLEVLGNDAMTARLSPITKKPITASACTHQIREVLSAPRSHSFSSECPVYARS